MDNGIKKRLAGLLFFVPAVLAAFVGVLFAVQSHRWSRILADDAQKIDNLNLSIQQTDARVESGGAEIVSDLTAVDIERVAGDKLKISGFMEDIMGWSDYKSYCEVRNEAMEKYELDEDSSFVQMFLPVVKEIMGTDGMRYNPIDNHVIGSDISYNMSFESVDTRLMYVDGLEYSYMAFVTWSTVGDMGYEGMHTDIITLTVGSDGNIRNLRAYFGVI